MIAEYGLANPAGLALLGLAVPVVLLHILRPRRLPVTVSSTFLWRRLERPVSSATPWQKLRWSWLLIAQLLAVALLALAVAKPVRLEDSVLAEHTVFIVDASGSMAAADGSPDRLATAKQRAIDLRRELGDDGQASIVVAAATPRVVLTTSDDPAAFEQALRTVEVSAGTADFRGAFSLAESLDTSSADIGFVFLSDGGVPGQDEKLLPPGTRYERIGDRQLNRAVELVAVEPRGGGLYARITVRNYDRSAVTDTVRVDVDGITVATPTVNIDAQSSAVVETELPPGDRVEAYLSSTDLLLSDDVGVAVAGLRPNLNVLLVGDTRFWAELYGSIPGLTVDVIERDDLPAGTAPDGDGYDVVAYLGVAVPEQPKAPFLAVAPPGGIQGIELTGVAELPAVTLLRGSDPLLTDLDLSDVSIAQAQRVDTTSAEVLVAGEDAPLLLRGEVADRRFAYLTFAISDSNLPVQVAFPILGDRILTELAGIALSSNTLTVGDALPVNPANDAALTDPNGQQRPYSAADPAPTASLAGFWTISTDGEPDRLVAVNPPVLESAIAPRPTMVAPVDDVVRTITPARLETTLLRWLLVPLLALLLWELWLSWRSRGVTRRQWKWAVGVRAAIAALLVGALLAPTLSRDSDRVATVYLLDGSASMSPAGADAAIEWLRASLAERPDDGLSAVVVFGGDARLDRVLEQSSVWNGAEVVVDPSATDIATALRLGAAVLPGDAARRVVVISDGRVTSGDALAEAASVAGRDVRVDVHTVDAARGRDVAVSSVTVPRLARVGDKIEVTVSVEATSAGTATVLLRRDGADIATQTVEVVPGTNKVVFTDEAGTAPGAVLRYQAVVSTADDTQPQNDTAFAAVPVDGPARTLIVEGVAGEADTLVAALQAAGLATEVIGPAEMPGVQELATYSGVILVNVDARTLTGDQIEALGIAVRDLGRGLVTIGGTNSYGVGGYRESPLSDLLPVDSEILDPKRRKTVAEVLSIDTSGSMANCHCEDATLAPNRQGGGVNKTDIAQAAAARTIGALTATDEIGVLAWNSGTEWVIDLQPLPDQATIDEGLGRLRPNGGTNLAVALADAADALLKSDAELRHIILFTDGFTDQQLIRRAADEAEELYETYGITVSVLGTGEGAAPSLKAVADAGRGRYYPGANINDVPQIMAEEAVIASRDFINEGAFLPEITSNDAVVAPLTESPALLGYIATTAKGEASTLMRIGPDRDPLLATWQAGLGRVSSWTSDASDVWSQQWASWDGYVDFWSRVVKDVFPTGDAAGAAQAQIVNGQLQLSVEGTTNFPDGATATATVAGPDGQRYEVDLVRTSADRFEGSLPPGTRPGTYAVGVVVDADGETVLSSSTLASESYPAEFAPGTADAALMSRISQEAGGRGEIEPSRAWDRQGLQAGVRRIALAGPFILLAALLFPLAVVLSRLSIRGATVAGARAGVGRFGQRLRRLLPSLGVADPDNAPAPAARRAAMDQRGASSASSGPVAAGALRDPSAMATPTAAPSPPAAATTANSTTAAVNELLARKRQRQSSDESDSSRS
jgi:Mg-chelatase subunit ChlD